MYFVKIMFFSNAHAQKIMRYIGFQPSDVKWNKSFIVLPLRTAHSDLYRQNLEPIGPKDSPWRKLSGIPLQPGRCQTGRDIQVRRWGCRRRPSCRSPRPSCSCSGCAPRRARRTPDHSHTPLRRGCLQLDLLRTTLAFLQKKEVSRMRGRMWWIYCRGPSSAGKA